MPNTKTPAIEVQYTLEIEPEEAPIKGHAVASGDDAYDAKVEKSILKQLARGNVWAWCCVQVIASVEIDGETFSGSDMLGCCSYKSEAAFKRDGYFKDMKRNALGDLIGALERAKRVGGAASRAVDALSAQFAR